MFGSRPVACCLVLVPLLGLFGTCPRPRLTAVELTLQPDRLLRGGETVTLTVAAMPAVDFNDTFAVGFVLPPDLEIITGTPVVRGAVMRGEVRRAEVTVKVPDDDFFREILAYAGGETTTRQEIGAVRRIEVNPSGRPHSTNRRDVEETAPVLLDLIASARLRRGRTVEVTLRAEVDAAHPAFEMRLDLPPQVQVLSGQTSLGPIAVAPGDVRTLSATVRISQDRETRRLYGVASFGKPADAGFGGSESVALETETRQ